MELRVISDGIATVVIGRNEGERLVKCLTSVRPHVACMVYVDSGSTDRSTQAAEQLGAHVVRLDTAEPFTAARARNAGFAALKALMPNVQFVQFIDGDCELVDAWLVTAMEFIGQRRDVAVVCGRRRERYPSASVYNSLCDIEWNTPVGEAAACGGDSLMRVEAFEPVGGFRAQLIAGEEPELCLRLREQEWKIWRLDAEMTRHDAAITRFRQWWMRTVRGGYAATEVARLHWHSPFAIWKWELARAVFWSGLVPVLIGAGALFQPIALTGALIYPFQICRIAIARGADSSESWTYALFMMLAKFAEFQGILTFHWRGLRRNTLELIEYK
jgi:glycosyltransferase involved in cell wall biosynthesis